MRSSCPPARKSTASLEDVEPDENGMVHALNDPGLGAKIDFGLIEHNKVAVLT